MSQSKKYPILYGKSRVGKIKEWEIRAVQSKMDDKIRILTKHGYIDGKKQLDEIIIEEGKNIGRANETTPFEQACNEAQAKWNGKKDSGYAESIDTIPQKILPMLAKDYNKYSHKIIFPCYIQPKLDGVRCLAKKQNNEIIFTSRKGKHFKTIPHIARELDKMMLEGDTFDGEIYIHGENFQDIISTIKNEKGNGALNSEQLQYHIYDIASNTCDFEKRLSIMNCYNNIILNNIIIVKTLICNNEADMKLFHDACISVGYEGCILRNKLGTYEFDYRSDNLQKYKEFKDEEYKIINVKPGKGRYNNCGCFTCITSDGKEFNVNPEGTMEIKQEYLTNKENYIGKLLTVKFQEKSKDGIPRFPVGLSVRDYE